MLPSRASVHLDLENSVGIEVVMNFVIYCIVWEQATTTNKMETVEWVMRIKLFLVVPFNDDEVAHGLHLDFTWLELMHIQIHLLEVSVNVLSKLVNKYTDCPNIYSYAVMSQKLTSKVFLSCFIFESFRSLWWWRGAWRDGFATRSVPEVPSRNSSLFAGRRQLRKKRSILRGITSVEGETETI